MRKIPNKRGESYIETAVAVVASMMVIVIALNIFSFLTLKQDLDYYAKEMMDTATIYGRTSNEVEERHTELCEELGIIPSYDFSASDYFNTAKKTIQLGETVRLTVTYQSAVKGLGVFSIPVTLTVKESGLSEKYWK